LLCDIHDGDGKAFGRDPRGIARRAEEYLRQSGIADTAMMSPEFEFYLFDSVRSRCEEHRCGYEIDSEEGEWNSDAPAARGTCLPLRGGYHALPPRDRLHRLRDEIVRLLEDAGIDVKYHHHEGGGPGQSEIEILFHPLLRAGDVTLTVKYFIRMAADRAGRSATFMPKPLWNVAGSGMHVHQHLFKAGKPLFWDAEGWANLSELALHYVGGILHHGPALLGLTNPSTNSYRRLVPGFEAPVNRFFSLANRSAAIRVPKYADAPAEKRIEFRPPDGTCNPYLAMAAMLMAGIDGIRKRIDPRKLGWGPVNDKIETLTPQALRRIAPVPASLREALQALEADHDFLLEGDVFPEDFFRVWVDQKIEREANEVRNRPHPYELNLYYDV
jgi:glutamine synthetase